MKAVILSRVSTKEQEEGHSISAQINRLRDYCKRKDLDIIREFTIVESSTRGERPDFYKMIDFIKDQKEKIALVCDKVDRLQRSFKEVPILEDLRRSGRLVLHFNVEGQILDENANSSQIMAYQMFVMMSENFTNCISDNVKRSFEKKLQDGTILGIAPIGYLNVKDVNDKSDVILDPDRAILVKRIFEEYATGLYSLKEIRKKTVEWGLRNKTKSKQYLQVSYIDKILKNPFYKGIMLYKNNHYPHKYPQLISKELFMQCENVRKSRTKVYSKGTKKEFIFKGLIRCKHCDCAISPEIKKGRYVYLRPNTKTGCNCKSINEKQALTVISSVLKSMVIPESILSEIKDTIKSSFEAKKDFNDASIKTLQKRYNEIQNKLNVLLEVRIEQSITKDEYDKKADELRSEQYNIRNKINSFAEADENFAVTLQYLLDLTSRSYSLFESSGNDDKRKIVKLVFSNLFLNGSKLEYDLNTPFNAMVNLGKNKKWGERGDSNPRISEPQSEALTTWRRPPQL